jgi:hypothetical protein
MWNPYTRRLAGTGHRLYVEEISSSSFSKEFFHVMMSDKSPYNFIYPLIQFLSSNLETVVCNLKLRRRIKLEEKGS